MDDHIGYQLRVSNLYNPEKFYLSMLDIMAPIKF